MPVKDAHGLLLPPSTGSKAALQKQSLLTNMQGSPEHQNHEQASSSLHTIKSLYYAQSRSRRFALDRLSVAAMRSLLKLLSASI